MIDCDCTTCAYSKKHPQLNAPRCWHVAADTITDEQIVYATAFAMDVRETNVQLILLRERALQKREHAARARCAEILNARGPA